MSMEGAIPGGFRWESSNIRIAADVPPELLEMQLPAQRGGTMRVVQGIPIPPLNLQARAQQQSHPWEDPELRLQSPQPPQPQSNQRGQNQRPASRLSVAASGSGTGRSGTPPRTPQDGPGPGGSARHGSARHSSASRASSRQRQRYGAWYVPPKEWKAVFGGGSGGGGGGSCNVSVSGMLPASASPASEGSQRQSTADGEAAAAERAARETMDLELGASYTARAYKEHLRAHNLRPPAVLERVPTPTEDQIRQHQMELARAAQLKRQDEERQAGGEARSVWPMAASTLMHAAASGGGGSAVVASVMSRHSTPPTGSTGAGATASGTATRPGTAQPPSAGAAAAMPPPGTPETARSQAGMSTATATAETPPSTAAAGPRMQETPRSEQQQLSARTDTNDSRLGDGASTVAPMPTAAAAAAAARAAASDGVETLDEVMAPALRQRIRHMLNLQDAVLDHQARMQAYEQERDRMRMERFGTASPEEMLGIGIFSSSLRGLSRRALLLASRQSLRRARSKYGNAPPPPLVIGGGGAAGSGGGAASPVAGGGPISANANAAGGSDAKQGQGHGHGHGRGHGRGRGHGANSGSGPALSPSRSSKRVQLQQPAAGQPPAKAADAGENKGEEGGKKDGKKGGSSESKDGGRSEEGGSAATAAESKGDAGSAGRSEGAETQQRSGADTGLVPEPSAASQAASSRSGGSRPQRSSLRPAAPSPPPQKYVLPGGQGDVVNLKHLLEKLPPTAPAPRPSAQGQSTGGGGGGGGPSSPQRQNVPGGQRTGSVAAAGAASASAAAAAVAVAVPGSDTARSPSPSGHQRRQSISLQQLHLQHTPRSNSPPPSFAAGGVGGGAWGEAIVQAALGGFPAGAAAVLLGRGDEPVAVQRSPSPTATAGGAFFITSAEPSDPLWLPPAERRPLVPPPPLGPADAGGDSIPLTVQVMLGLVDGAPQAVLQELASSPRAGGSSMSLPGSLKQSAPARGPSAASGLQLAPLRHPHHPPPHRQSSAPAGRSEEFHPSPHGYVSADVVGYVARTLDYGFLPEDSVGQTQRSHASVDTFGESEASQGSAAAAAAARILWERHRLPPEHSLPARIAGASAVDRGGGGAHSLAPEQVAAFASSTGRGQAVQHSGQSASGAPLRPVPPPPPALAAALRDGGGGAGSSGHGGLLPELGGRASAEQGHSGRRASNGPAGDLYALGLLPNPSLLRASMASAATRAPPPRRRRGSGLHGTGYLSDLLASSASGAPLPQGLSTSASNLELPPTISGGSFSGGGTGGGGGFSAPATPTPPAFVHTHPHQPLGSPTRRADAAEQEAMHARTRMGRVSPLDLQHMLGIDVPPPLLSAHP